DDVPPAVVPRSTTVTSQPAAASDRAQAAPMMPAPTIITSLAIRLSLLSVRVPPEQSLICYTLQSDNRGSAGLITRRKLGFQRSSQHRRGEVLAMPAKKYTEEQRRGSSSC